MSNTFNFIGDQRVFQGATGIWRFTVYSGIVIDPVFLVNLTGYTVRMQVRASVESTDIIFEASTTDGRIVLTGASGYYTLTITAAQSAAIAAGEYVHQIELVNGSGAVERHLQGSFIVDAEVVR